MDQKAGRGGGSLVVFYLTVIYSVMLIFGAYYKQSFFLRVNLHFGWVVVMLVVLISYFESAL